CRGTEAVWRPLAWVAAVGGSLAIAGGLVGRVPPSLLAGLAVALVGVVRAGLRAEDAKAGDAPGGGGDGRYGWRLAFLLLAVAAFPSFLVFRDAYSLTVEEFIKRGQVRHVHAIEALLAEARRADPSGAPRVDPRRVYAAAFFGVGRTAPCAPGGCG